MDAFRTRKETIKATYTAAEAQTRINEAFSGISEEMGDVGLAIQRAEDKTAQMQARAGAIDELLASGALEDHVSGPQDGGGRDPQGLVHISGGGLLNLGRLAADVSYELDALPPPPPIFTLIAEAGQVPAATMYATFNMGTGFCVVVPSGSCRSRESETTRTTIAGMPDL